MDSLSLRLKAVFFPSLILAILFVAGYTLLRWLLAAHFHVFEMVNPMWGLFLLVLSLALVYIFIYSRVKIFAPSENKMDIGQMKIFGLAYLLVAVPALIAQSYLVTATAKLTMLDDASALYTAPSTMYYNIRHCYTNKGSAIKHVSRTIGGRDNGYECFNISYAVPIFRDSTDTTLTARTVWLGIEYNDEILRRNTSKEELDAAQQKFVNESEKNFEEKNLRKFACLKIVQTNTSYNRFNKAIQERLSAYNYNSMVLIPFYEPYDAHNGEKFAWIFGAMGIIGLVLFVVVALATLDKKEVQRYLNARK